MPALPVIEDVFRVALNWTSLTVGNAVNVMHFGTLGGDSDDLYDALNAQATASMWSWVESGSAVYSVDITPLDGITATKTYPTGHPAKWAGGSGSATPMAQVAGVIKMTTAKRGRSYRGRIFLPFIAENEYQNGFLLDVAAVQAAWDNWHADVETAGFPLVVASYTLASAEPVTALLAEDAAATQRRRMSRLRA